MRRREALILVSLIIVAGAAAFLVGRSRAAGQHERTPRWLQDAPAAAVEAERRFERQASELAEAVCAKRAVFSSLLADPNATDDQIGAQLDSVLESHAALVRAVGQRLIRLRNDLPEAQARQLMQSCASSLQGQVQRRYRWRGGAQEADFQGRGGGRGAGYGRQYRGGRGGGPGFARRLRLTDEQTVWMEQQDPNFEADTMLQRDRLSQAHADLTAGLEDPQATDQELLARVDILIDAHRQLERRVARSVMLLRPHLSPEQREHLVGLCGGGPGPWHGGPASRDHTD